MTQVSLTTSTNYDGSLNAVVEDQGTVLTFRFELDEPAPNGGLKVYLDSNVVQSLNRLDLGSLLFDPNAIENIDLSNSSVEENNSAIAATIAEGARFATITLPIFDNEEPDTFLPETFDGLTEVTFTLKTANQVSGVNGIGDYTVNPSATNSLVLFADTASQLPTVTPTPIVSLSASPTNLVEEDGTLMTLTINLSEPPPEGGIDITIDSDVPNSLAQFDVLGATYNGARLAGANSDASGFTVRVTQQTATIQLAPFDDDVDEGLQNIIYTLQSGDGYAIDSAASSVSINIEDNDAPTEPVVSFSATPTTISEAEGTALVMNFSVDGDIPEEGITVKLEGDAARIMQQFSAAQTRFNDSGETFNRFDKGLVNNNVVGGTLELFSLEDGDSSESASNPEAAGDAYLTNFTFTITEPTASITIPVFDDLIEEEDATYTYNLVEGDGYMVDSSASSATFTVTDGVVGGGGPTVGVSAAPTTLFESEQTALTLTFTTEGDIPPEGVVVVLEGPPRAIAEFDVNATNPRLPEDETEVTGIEVEGGNIVGTNETAGALIFRITDAEATITVPVFQDEVEEGLETLNFNLKDGELYNVDSSASAVSVTIEDVVPEPVVTFSADKTTLVESNQDFIELSFNVDGKIPADGLPVSVKVNTTDPSKLFFVDFSAGDFEFESGTPNVLDDGNIWELKGADDGTDSGLAIVKNDDIFAIVEPPYDTINLTLTENTASIRLPILDDVITEEDETVTFTLEAGDGYKVADTNAPVTVTLKDGDPSVADGPTVSLSANATNVVEGQEITFTIDLDQAPPAEGVRVLIDSDTVASTGEFDVSRPRVDTDGDGVGDTRQVLGVELTGVADEFSLQPNEDGSGFFLNITEQTATLKVKVADDGIEEGMESFTYRVVEGEDYNVSSTSGNVKFTIQDGPIPEESAQVEFETNDNGEVTALTYQVTGVAPGETATVSISEDILELSDAAFDNLVGFYEVIDGEGTVVFEGVEYKPGDDGYARAALENAVDGFALRVGGDTSDNTSADEFDPVVEGGKFYAPFAIANAGSLTPEEFLAMNPNNDAATSIDSQVAYFAFGEANPDKANHLKSLGEGMFGFEDLPSNLAGVSDSDFNDAVFKFDFVA